MHLLLQDPVPCGLSINTVIRFNDVEVWARWMLDERARGELKRQYLLLELVAELGNLEDPMAIELDPRRADINVPQCITSDTNETIWTHGRRERGHIFKSVIDERGALQQVLVRVQQP